MSPLKPGNKGVLHMVATPIGNLGDISERMRAVLSSCDVVAAEDTRVARKLLSSMGVSGKRMVSVRQHNERSAAAKLAATHGGGSIAYLSDAGAPATSDPGALLVDTLRKAGFEIRSLPGPSAVTSAMSVAGFGGDGHVFGGFIPRSAEKAVTRLRELGSVGLPIVVFEAPGRVGALLAAIGEAFGDGTMVCVCSELTKLHEQVKVATCAEHIADLTDGEEPRGEFTLVVDTPVNRPSVPADAHHVLGELAKELPLAKACKIAARLTGADSRELYKLASGDRDNARRKPR